MRYFLFIIIGLFLLIVPVTALAQSATPTEKASSPTEEAKSPSLNQQISDLKDKIASKVAQLNLVDKRGIIGEVQEVRDTRITLIDSQRKSRIVDIDEITKFASPSAKSTVGISDIKNGQTVSIIGYYNKQSRRILGRFVTILSKPTFISGVIGKINEDDFTVSVIDTTNTTTIVDIERITKTNAYEDGEIVRSGFSQLKVGDRVVVTGTPLTNQRHRITGLRILTLPETPKHPAIKIPDSAAASLTPADE